MDRTADCRDKCASSAYMLECMRDCTTRPASVGPISPSFKMNVPRLFEDIFEPDNRKNIIIGSIIVIAVIGGGFLLVKSKKKLVK